MASLILTVTHRPYVVLFLLAFLVLATFQFGILRTLIWGMWGYVVAFLSEVSSIHNGFPYGLYHYLPENFAGELVLCGVPVWDSLSYVFIAYASYATASFLIEPLIGRFKIDPHLSPSRPFPVLLTASFLMMLADVVIDPISLLGDQWFLGKIYFYPTGGLYFGVPLTNFVGWFLVAGVMMFGFQLMEKHFFTRFKLPTLGAKRFFCQALLGPCFYFGILGFMLTVTAMIGANHLLLASGSLTLVLLTLVFKRIWQHCYYGRVSE